MSDTEINYEEEVRKIHPEAICFMPEYFDIYVVKDKPKGRDVGSAYFKDSAWKDAYDYLKGSGIIE